MTSAAPAQDHALPFADHYLLPQHTALALTSSTPHSLFTGGLSTMREEPGKERRETCLPHLSMPYDLHSERCPHDSHGCPEHLESL